MARKLVTMLALIFILFVSTTGFASKILSIPTADLKNEGQGSLEYRYARGQSRLEVNWGPISRLNLGVGRDGGQFFAALKVGLLEEEAGQCGLALGAEIGTESNEFYGVLSKQLGATPGLRGHLALGTGRYKRGMAGVSLVLNPVRLKTKQGFTLPATSALLVYDGKGLTGGVAAVFSAGLKAHVALEDFRTLGFGASYEVAF